MENMVSEIDDYDSPLLEKIVQDGIIVKGGGGFDASGRHSTFRYPAVRFSYPLLKSTLLFIDFCTFSTKGIKIYKQ